MVAADSPQTPPVSPVLLALLLLPARRAAGCFGTCFSRPRAAIAD